MIRVLFDLKKEYYLNSLEPLYRLMEKDPRYDVWIRAGSDRRAYCKIWTVSGRSRIQSDLEQRGYRVTEETRGFDVVVCGDALKNPQRFGDVLRVHLDHGVGIKTLRIRNIVRQHPVHYHVFLEGLYWYDFIREWGWQDKAAFHITGLPKLDPLFWKGYYQPDALKRRLNLSREKSTVLFAPSYKPSCIPHVKEKIAELVPRYNVIVKLHPYSWGGKYAPHSQHRFYERLAEKEKNLYLIPPDDFDIYPYLMLADTLISDTSSVVNEFLALGRHGVIYVLPYERLMHSDGMPVLSIDPGDWLKGAFVHIDDPRDLPAAVETALNPTVEMRRQLKKHRNYFFHRLDGKASFRVKAKIDELMKGRS